MDKLTEGPTHEADRLSRSLSQPGEKPHHYPADLEPNALAPALKKDAFFDVAREHVLRIPGPVLQYDR